MLPYLSACLPSCFWRDPFLEVEKLTNLCGRGSWESFLTMGEILRVQIPKGRAYVNFCSRPTTCCKKSNLLKCCHVNIFISVVFSHHTKNTTDEQTDRHAADLVFWDTALTAIGKSKQFTCYSHPMVCSNHVANVIYKKWTRWPAREPDQKKREKERWEQNTDTMSVAGRGR